MKQHITPDDLRILTPGQQDRLRTLWKPKKYDLVFTELCTDAQAETYEPVVFVVGKVEAEERSSYTSRVFGGCAVTLYDNRFLADADDELEDWETGTPADEDDEDEDDDELYEDVDDEDADEDVEDDEEYEDDEDEEEDEDDDGLPDDILPELSRPSDYDIEVCLPLLSIGGMLSLLVDNHFDERGFQLDFTSGNVSLSRGNQTFGATDEDEEDELCDLLWQAVTELL